LNQMVRRVVKSGNIPIKKEKGKITYLSKKNEEEGKKCLRGESMEKGGGCNLTGRHTESNRNGNKSLKRGGRRVWEVFRS